MKILAIETSCDETSIAILDCSGDLPKADFSFDVLAHSLNSQIDIHQEYGGVFPTLAKREHSKNLIPLLKQTLTKANLLSNSIESLSRFAGKEEDEEDEEDEDKIKTILTRESELLEQFLEFIPTIKTPDVDAIAVTVGPGLEPALWVGLNFAKALSFVWDKPLVPVNHMEGHIFSVLIDGKNMQNNPACAEASAGRELRIMNYEYAVPPSPVPIPPSVLSFPAIALLISGGHTQLVLVRDWGEYEIIGETRDDAVGEAFDKVARMLGLPYPGGPEISRLANQSRNKSKLPNSKSQTNSKKEIQNIKLPRPMINTDDFDFSFSGLKTAVLYKIKDREISDNEKMEIAREFEDAVIEVLVKKTKNALMKFGAGTLIVGGGVIANKHIRESLEKLTQELGIEIRMPDMELTGDNAVMIGIAGYIKSKIENGKWKIENDESMTDGKNDELRVDGNLRL